MQLAAVVVHHRNWPGISETLRALEQQSRAPGVLVVVDSCSDDGSVDEIRHAFPSWRLLELGDNAGYAAAVNAALRLDEVRGADYVLVCTHEAILRPDAAELMTDALAADKSIGAAGPVLTRRSTGDVWSAGGGLGRRTARPWHRQDPPARGSGTRAAQWVDGAVVLYRTEAMRDVGPFDEGYFLYYEELDYQTRLQHRGWRVVVVADASAAQEPGMVPPYLEARNRVRWLRRDRRLLPLLFAIVEQLATAMATFVVRGRRWETPVRLRGVVHGFTGRLDRDVALRRPATMPSNASSC